MSRRNPHLRSPYPNTFRISAATMHSLRLLLSNHHPADEEKMSEFNRDDRH